MCGKFGMDDQTIYLDISAIVKRYIIEEETNRIDKIYEKLMPERLG